jgi:uncharacterized protein YjdB
VAGDQLMPSSFACFSICATTASISGNILTVTPIKDGTVTITVTASDGGVLGDASTTFNVDVLDVVTAEAFTLNLNVTSAAGGSQDLSFGDRLGRS